MEQLENLLRHHHFEFDPLTTSFEVNGWLKKEQMAFVKTFYDESQLRTFVHECLHSSDCYLQGIAVHYAVSQCE